MSAPPPDRAPVEPLAAKVMRRLRLLWIACLAITAGRLIEWALRQGLDHDEIEHAHAAWLIHDGAVAFRDFFEHHPPYYWHLLRLYYALFGEDLGVLLWARGWMIATSLLAIWLIYRIGRELYGPLGGLAAGAIAAACAPLYEVMVEARPDGPSRALVLAGVWLLVRVWDRGPTALQGLAAGLLIGAGLTIHPRAVFLAGGLLLGLAWIALDPRRRAGARALIVPLAALALGALAPLVLPFLSYGPSYGDVIYAFNSDLRPYVGSYELRMHVLTWYVHLPALLGGLVLAVRHLRAAPRGEAWREAVVLGVVVLGLGAVLWSPRAFLHVYWTLLVAIALAGGRAVAGLAEGLERPAAIWTVALFVGACALMPLRPQSGPYAPTLARDLAEHQATLATVPPGERFLGSVMIHPVFRRDGCYHWFNLGMVYATERARSPGWSFDLNGDVERRKPFVVQRYYVDVVCTIAPEEGARLEALLARDYERQGDFYWRRSR